MYDFIKTIKHERVVCNACFQPLFETITVMNFNRPRYGKIKKYRDFERENKVYYYCKDCAGKC